MLGSTLGTSEADLGVLRHSTPASSIRSSGTCCQSHQGKWCGASPDDKIAAVTISTMFDVLLRTVVDYKEALVTELGRLIVKRKSP